MARVKPQDIVDELSSRFRRTLADVSKVLPQRQFDEYELFRAFKRAVGRKCGIWERVQDSYVGV